MPHVEAFGKASAGWKTLNDEQKRPYKEQHEKLVQQWEARTGKQLKKKEK